MAKQEVRLFYFGRCAALV